MSYDQIQWLPLTAGLAILGLIVSFFVWRRRGAAAGLRGVAWSLLPVAAYLIGAIELLWRFGSAIASFASSFVFSPRVWAGIIVATTAKARNSVPTAMVPKLTPRRRSPPFMPFAASLYLAASDGLDRVRDGPEEPACAALLLFMTLEPVNWMTLSRHKAQAAEIYCGRAERFR